MARRNATQSNSAAMKDVSRTNKPSPRLAQAAPMLFDYYSALGMVIGGCCTNVWAYEELLLINPRIGSALTFSQMLFITLQSLPSFLNFRGGFPRLKPRQVPLSNWATQVTLVTAGSLFNNWVYAYKVPLTVMIVFRSAGLAVSMLLGYFVMHKRYTVTQVFSAAIVSIGVVFATLSRSSASTTTGKLTPESAEDLHKYTLGIIMLSSSLLISGILGILQERTYKKYGPCWREGVFYTHFLSLPIFLFLIPDIQQGMQSLSAPQNNRSAPLAFALLITNLLSQLVCVRGVNRLTSQVSSVSTNLVLTIRKALSLCFSVWWFGNPWNARLVRGAGMVFAGGLLFGWGGDGKSVQDDQSTSAKKGKDSEKKTQ
ncbi:UAA transporter [Schizophyllum amplum]|uniref:UAA transporter n=1 Tax=Schizophyllum amplum TaxID=97359 RepID=A0A550C8M5_9AGAR|nr:UAA transporter [Auriculariopsis ampla]